MKSSDYYIAQVCVNGHPISAVLDSVDETDQAFCDKCGQATTMICAGCGTAIRGRYRGFGFGVPYLPPSYCHACGEPYPWTVAKLEAARELADELDDLTDQERQTLKRSLDDLVADAPRTTVAVTRFKKLVAKAGPTVAEGFKEILVDVVSESVKKAIWP